MIGKKYVHDNKNMWYNYFFYLIFILYILFLIYAKVHSPFWFSQPVLHNYELYPVMRRLITSIPYYRYTIKPKFDSYCNTDIYTFQNTEINTLLKDKIIKLLQGHYYDNEYILYHINSIQLNIILTNNSFISCLFEKKLIEMNYEFSEKYNNEILGIVSSRNTNIYFNAFPQMNSSIHYIDFLCVNDEHKKPNNYRSLIKTHIFNHSQLESSHSYSYIIKKEISLCKDVIPLCEYKTFTFNIQKTPIQNLPYNYYIEKLDSNRIEIWKTIYYQLTNLFVISIIPPFEQTIEWLKNERYIIYILTYKTNTLNILGVYFFEKIFISIENIENNKNEMLRLTASMIFDNYHFTYTELFFKGFLHACKNIFLDHKKLGVLEIPNISMNNIILDRWQEKYSFHNCTDTALYSYNLIIPFSKVIENNVICIT